MHRPERMPGDAGLRIPMRGYELDSIDRDTLDRLVTNPHEGL